MLYTLLYIFSSIVTSYILKSVYIVTIYKIQNKGHNVMPPPHTLHVNNFLSNVLRIIHMCMPQIVWLCLLENVLSAIESL